MLELDPVIYPRKIWIVPKEELDEFCSRTTEGNIEFPSDCDGATWSNIKKRDTGEFGALIAFDGTPTPETIAHESVHAANSVFADLDVIYNMEDDETLAYLVGWIVKNIHDKYLNNE